MKLGSSFLALVTATNSLFISAGMLEQELSLHPFSAGFDNFLHSPHSHRGGVTDNAIVLPPLFSADLPDSEQHPTIDRDAMPLCIEPYRPGLVQESGLPGCLPLPEKTHRVIVHTGDDHSGHQAIMLLPVNKERLIIPAVSNDHTDASIIPLPCEQDECVAWGYNGEISVLDLSETVLTGEPGAVETSDPRTWEVIRTTDHNGHIIYQLYDGNGHLHTISEWEFNRRLAMYFQSLLEFLYPEFFGPSLPAGGGWHRWQYWKVRRTSDRPGSTSEQPWSVWQTRQSRRKKERLAAAATPVQQARSRKYQPHYKSYRPEPSAPAKDTGRTVKNEIDELLRYFESRDLQIAAAKFKERYDGRKHGPFCNKIKMITLARKEPLADDEKLRFVPFMHHLSQVADSFNELNLSICIHSLVTSQLLYFPHSAPGQRTAQKGEDRLVKEAQKALIETLLKAIKSRANQQKEETGDGFSDQATSNLLWALANLVENGRLQPDLYDLVSKVVTTVLPLVLSHQDDFTPQGVSVVLLALAKLVAKGLPQLQHDLVSKVVTVLLPQVLRHQYDFVPYGVSSVLLALPRLVESRRLQLDLEGLVSEAVTAMLLQVASPLEPEPLPGADSGVSGSVITPASFCSVGVGSQQSFGKLKPKRFNLQELSSLLWSLAGLSESRWLWLNQDALASKAVTVLLLQVVPPLESSISQQVSFLLSALARLLEGGQLQLDTKDLVIKAAGMLLPYVVNPPEPFKPCETSSLLMALAKLLENRRPQLSQDGLDRKAVETLLLQVVSPPEPFKPYEISNLLMALARLLENRRPQLHQDNLIHKAMGALLLQALTPPEPFKPHQISNFLWALAKLVDKGWLQLDQGGQGGQASEAVAALLPQLLRLPGSLESQDIANLLWALALLGESISLNEIINILRKIDINTIKSWQDQEATLWALTVFLARGGETKLMLPLMQMLYDDLVTEKENSSDKRATIMLLAGIWLKASQEILPRPRYGESIVSYPHRTLRVLLERSFPHHTLEIETSVKDLPPVDLLFPHEKAVVEVQGAKHYVDKDKRLRNGSTILKNKTYEKLGYRVFEIGATDVYKLEKYEQLLRELHAYFSNKDK